MRQSRDQLLAPERAARDSDCDVRNNATRALGVLLRSNPKLASGSRPGVFIEMLNSDIWTERNKGAALLEQLTAERDAELLAKIRAAALDSLIEMAAWRRASHAYFARMVVGRVAGIPEERLRELASSGLAGEIIEAISF